MRDLLKKFRNGVVIGLGLYAGTALAATTIPQFTVNGTNPIQGLVNTINDFNSTIAAINAQFGNYISFNWSTAETGEFALLNSQSWVANGSVATSVTSVGPGGSHTTIQEWLVVIDNNGTVRYVPAY